MGQKATLTVYRPPEEVRDLWDRPDLRSGYLADAGATVEFVRAPGDRGTEVHIDLGDGGGKKIAGVVPTGGGGTADRAKAMDELRRFKQLVETGVIARSDAIPEGELAERKLKQRPAQPLDADELEKAGV